MGQTAVSVQNVSKKYRLFNSPRERFLEAFHPFNKKYHREFWALKDISFAVEKGQTIGIIGKNGSGKSTLLQVISSVLKPTSGEVNVNGRVSSILELGCGFNPEFTGRENVFINGQIMGFSREEMKNRLPEIAAFADIGDFLDQPVKIYSSGMFVRLAFAAAINVDPDILIIDEALSVGDAKFQHKCFGKFHEFQNTGRTILFVSHNTDAVIRHCDWAILLNDGEITAKGEPKEIVNYYVDLLFTGQISGFLPQPLTKGANTDLAQKNELEKFLADNSTIDNCVNRKSYNKNEYHQKQGKADIIDYLIVSNDQIDPMAINCGDTVDIYIKAKFNEYVELPLFGFSVKTVDGILLYALNSFFTCVCIAAAEKSDIIVVKFSFKLRASAGDVFIDIGVDESPNSANKTGRKCLYDSLDRRCGVAHLSVREKNWFHGLADFEAECCEITRSRKSGIIANDR